MSQFAKTKNYCSAHNTKRKGGRAKKINITLVTAMRAAWGSQSGGHGPNRLLENYARSVANFRPKLGGFLLGWGGLLVHSITTYTDPKARGI